MNIIEYITVFGQKELSPFNINESDILVMTALSYMDFSVCGFEDKIKLSDAINQLLSFSIQHRDQEFLMRLRESRRFSDLYICGYRNEYDDLNHAMQFSALTVKISDSLWFISYSGTDGTVVGWKEDFQFSYLPQTPAQEKALSYLVEASHKLDGNFIISGHSKGGNLAAYASIFADSAIQKRINSVFCHDAPGFNEDIDVLSMNGYYNIIKKIHCILPPDSIIGQLLRTFPVENCHVIYSRSSNILLQHDIFRWQIDETGNPQWLSSLNLLTKKFMEKINHAIGKLSMEQRERFTECIFNALEQRNIKHIESLKYFIPVEYFPALR